MPVPHALLAGIVDYAGLFPPAGLAMGPAVRHHARYRAGPTAWMLGRFVVPAARLEEFEAAAFDLLPAADDAEPWRLSALAGSDVAADAARLAAFDARHAPDREAGRAVVDVLEARVATPDACAALAPVAARGVDVYAEVPWQAPDAFPAFAGAARAAGVRLKLRTGGVTPDAFPPPDAVLAFLVACRDAGVAAKATAGLHHPLAGEHALTYEPGCARGTMYGFVNVFLAAALLRLGHEPARVRPLLTERDAAAFAADDAAVAWRGLRADAAALADARAHALVAFGSCSFEEPVADLRALGWLPDAHARRP
jgi:hypothetical protein